MTTHAHGHSHDAAEHTGVVARGLAGIIGGLVGGILFGVLMAMMGMLETVAMLVGSNSPVVGGVVHLAIAAGFGVLFAVLWTRAGLPGLLIGGAVYGAIVWVVGALLIMPVWLGEPVLEINAMTLQSLMGHVIYGIALGGTLFGLRHRGH
ncbi:hypothetical protein [Ruania alba]|uniref:Uncharacterized protein n=1 Tax=Ruania alba TaxID=648782 RepID=A0A1H5KTC1_9MICO|nr:hypothetical protein [Ruania alba]SEE68075.1 hypothetical protein SAMN04488554_2441 [Ruania alba]